MSTRAAAATWTLRAKQHLIRLLFASEHAPRSKNRWPPNVSNTRQLQPETDHSKYSYSDLRVAYLERIQTLHPDKQKSNQYFTSESRTAPSQSQTMHNKDTTDCSTPFIELLNAWNQYDAVAKDCKRGGKRDNNDANEANFTMFGVGCSFSDTDEERELRARIMDQASRGWFSMGELQSSSLTTVDSRQSTSHSSLTPTTPQHHVPLSCDAMFQATQFVDNDRALHARNQGNECAAISACSKSDERGRRCSLVAHLIPPHRR